MFPHDNLEKVIFWSDSRLFALPQFKKAHFPSQLSHYFTFSKFEILSLNRFVIATWDNAASTYAPKAARLFLSWKICFFDKRMPNRQESGKRKPNKAGLD